MDKFLITRATTRVNATTIARVLNAHGESWRAPNSGTDSAKADPSRASSQRSMSRAKRPSRPSLPHHLLSHRSVPFVRTWISPGHPTADGRTFGDRLAGSKLDTAHSVLSAELVPYAYDATFDILPASSTGTYFAAGALIGSALFRPQ